MNLQSRKSKRGNSPRYVPSPSYFIASSMLYSHATLPSPEHQLQIGEKCPFIPFPMTPDLTPHAITPALEFAHCH
jgi:hypothetical protein